MNATRDRFLHAAATGAADKLHNLAGALTRDPHADREVLRAEVEFQRWFVDSCQDTVDDPK